LNSKSLCGFDTIIDTKYYLHKGEKKVGKGLDLSTDNDEKSAKYINSKDAFF